MEILTIDEKRKALRIARTSIAEELGIHYIEEKIEPSGNLTKKYGAFVTLEKQNKLRGCIGLIYPIKPLYEAIKEMAKESAFKDPRFPPLQKKEFDEIEIEISVLTPLQKIDKISDIKVGRDGLLIRKGRYSGLLLPQVATRYGWDEEEFLSQTCVKAGLPYDIWRYEDVEIYIFQADVFKESEV
jgi:AmmeMemoRadiSam system protein A